MGINGAPGDPPLVQELEVDSFLGKRALSLAEREKRIERRVEQPSARTADRTGRPAEAN